MGEEKLKNEHEADGPEDVADAEQTFALTTGACRLRLLNRQEGCENDRGVDGLHARRLDFHPLGALPHKVPVARNLQRLPTEQQHLHGLSGPPGAEHGADLPSRSSVEATSKERGEARYSLRQSPRQQQNISTHC